ncbi:MAG: tetratricopeptide repeat protein [Thermodesulfovibrionales bacterium]
MLYYFVMGRASGKQRRNDRIKKVGEYIPEISENPSGVRPPLKVFIRNANLKHYLAASVSLITFLVYLKSLQNGFLGWDDGIYVVLNPYIRSITPSFFRWAFFFDFYASNWHPLTWLSHALDYAVWGLNPLGHHLTNNILHALNTFIVVLLVVRLSEFGKVLSPPSPPLNVRGDWGAVPADRGWSSDKTVLITAGTTGLLFGLHPIHVESVAWVAERKDLLCALFYLLSVITYVKYATCKTYRTYIPALCFFVLALLSKPMAVTLPFVLLILDWYPFGRIQSLRSFGIAFFEKLPFIALIIISSVLTILAQKAAMMPMDVEPLSARVLVACRSIVFYLWNVILPLRLLPYYQYPEGVSLLSLQYPLYIVLVIGITAFALVSAKKRRFWLAVWGYYVITLLPVLGFVQVGGQAMADRYMYLPSLGPFVVIGVGIAWVAGKITTLRSLNKSAVAVTSGIALSLFVLMIFLTLKQIVIWKNDIDLWSYVINKEPGKVIFAYVNRGKAFGEAGQFNRAIEDYSEAIIINPSNTTAIVNRGLAYLQTDQTGPGIADLRRACDLGDDFGCKALPYFGVKLPHAADKASE